MAEKLIENNKVTVIGETTNLNTTTREYLFSYGNSTCSIQQCNVCGKKFIPTPKWVYVKGKGTKRVHF